MREKDTGKASSEKDNGEESQKKPYSSPHLFVYGTLTNLTTGGSGAVAEGKSKTKWKRP